MVPRADVSEERKSQILDAAMDTFAEKGIHKSRMSDIADRSGLSKGSLYWYFDSKDSIVMSLLKRVLEPELAELKTLLNDRSRSAEERLIAYAERGGEDIIQILKWMPLFYDFIAMAFRQESIRKTVTSFYKQNIDLLEELIQQGIDSGEFQTDSALDAAISIGAIIEGTIVLWIYDPEQIHIRERVITNLRLILNGIRKS